MSNRPSQNIKEVDIINSDIYAGLKSLKNKSIDYAVTSPPYWGQRDYGFEGQIGNEDSYEEYIKKLGSALSPLKEKLSDKGVFFFNVGDKYINQYGNSKKGMIPYQLAQFLKEDGWIISDILIWYKPNHMPSSVTNRLSNTYEPIFILAKNKKNYFTEFVKNNDNFSSILKINLQQTQYDHVAVYPEELVKKTLAMGIPENATVLDPFAGSGTTARAVIDTNKKHDLNRKCILIEANRDYIEIIKDRCNLPKNTKVKNIKFKKYKYKNIDINKSIKNLLKSDKKNSKFKIPSNGGVKIFKKKKDFKNFINYLNKNKENINNDSILYLGVKDNSLESILIGSYLNKSGWVIRNQIIIKNKKSWFPVYLIAKDTTKTRYKINIDPIRKDHKNQKETDWSKINFLGMEVSNSLNKEKEIGKIIKIKNKYKNNKPKEVIVEWEKDEKFTKEIVYSPKFIDNKPNFLCPNCNNKLEEYYSRSEKIKCENCKESLWQGIKSLPKIEINHKFYPIKSNGEFNTKSITNNKNEKNYNGKYKNKKRLNMGASPGARSATQGTSMSADRFYNINQNLVADMLKIILNDRGLSRAALTRKFPDSYKYTVGHWFRKDMGGSLPVPKDVMLLDKFIDLPKYLINYLNSRVLQVQMVKKHHKGKNPGDYLEISSHKKFFKKTIV